MPQYGTLALVGGGEYEPLMERVDRYLLEQVPDEPRVICVPTAGSLRGASWVERCSNMGVDHFTRLGANADAVAVIDRVSANEETAAARIRQANFVYMSGGRPDYLFRTLAGSLAWQAIAAVLESGGVVAGSSAGSMVFGERFAGYPRPWPWHRGFNIYPKAIIIPHWNEIPPALAWLARASRLARPTVLGIDRYTALVNSDFKFRVVGAGTVTVWSRRRKRRYADGDLALWP